MPSQGNFHVSVYSQSQLGEVYMFTLCYSYSSRTEILQHQDSKVWPSKPYCYPTRYVYMLVLVVPVVYACMHVMCASYVTHNSLEALTLICIHECIRKCVFIVCAYSLPDNVLRTVLALFMEDGELPLPTLEEVLICNSTTTAEEVCMMGFSV